MYVNKTIYYWPFLLAIIIGNPRDVGVTYAAEEFHIDTLEHYAQIASNA